MTALTAASLTGLDVPTPSYARSRLDVGIVHIGVGGFHRSHEAMYVDRLLTAGASEWAICGVGTQPFDRRMRDVMVQQDFLYTLVVKHGDGLFEPQVIGSIVDYLYAPDDSEAVVERMAAPTTHIVSLTITEGGYLVDPVTRQFQPSEPAVLLDLQPGAVPGTVFGLVIEAVLRRRKRGIPPFTVLSCDNVPANGQIAREAFGGFASIVDAELGEWVRNNVSFPNSMVDRITPVTVEEDRMLLEDRFDVSDGWPVVCEPFEQWVLEDDFCDGRPDWAAVGVQLVDDVQPYELMKLRLLNAGHQAIGYLGYLAGYRFTDEVCNDADFVRFVHAYMTDEATPTLPPVYGIDIPAYRRTLIERFANPHIRDTLARLCAHGSDRIPTFLLPVIRDQLAHGGSVSQSALVVAAWARYAEGYDEEGKPIEVVDRRLEAIRSAAADPDPLAFLRNTGVFGGLQSEPVFVEAYLAQRELLNRVGARVAVAASTP